MLWSHNVRGFHEDFAPYKRYENPLDQEIGSDLSRRHDFGMKVPMVSEETDYQHVDIYEVINPLVNLFASYERSLSEDGSYEPLHPYVYKPDRVLFLDGVLQSR